MEQRSLLQKKTFSFRPLASAGMLHLWGTFNQAVLPSIIFFFGVFVLTLSIRSNYETLVTCLFTAGMFILLVYPVIAFSLIGGGIVAKKWSSQVRWPAVIFWSWWPFWKLVMCVAAAHFATRIGNFLWYDAYLPHIATASLQAYSNIDPSTVKGVRLQDAGIVQFNTSARVDRSRTGCLKNGGTYCVAPIIIGDDLKLSGLTSRHDLFMAGMDCCTCPGEFRCGEWDVPFSALGGLRVLQPDTVAFYRLASQDWAATYGMKTDHALFFTMASDPVKAFGGMEERGHRMFLLSMICAPVIFIGVAFILNFILGQLTDYGCAAPLEAPVIRGGMAQGMARRMLPGMTKYDDDQRMQAGSGL